jgi:Fe-S oxidoreductase
MYDIISFENVEKHFEQIDWNETKLDINIINNIKEKNNFQTKSLDNYFGNYIISSDGRLKSQHFEEYEHVVDENNLDNLDILEFFVDFKIKFINGDLEAIKLFNVEKF